jgi:hypothetical protein
MCFNNNKAKSLLNSVEGTVTQKVSSSEEHINPPMSHMFFLCDGVCHDAYSTPTHHI